MAFWLQLFQKKNGFLVSTNILWLFNIKKKIRGQLWEVKYLYGHNTNSKLLGTHLLKYLSFNYFKKDIII
jgi:hypothetical protein